ncbi:hypothetical protein J007_05110 [Cryptococcus neoformans]|nr:hypothetical protein J007_05110 [Cryptococcus neoformans var. grubii]
MPSKSIISTKHSTPIHSKCQTQNHLNQPPLCATLPPTLATRKTSSVPAHQDGIQRVIPLSSPLTIPSLILILDQRLGPFSFSATLQNPNSDTPPASPRPLSPAPHLDATSSTLSFLTSKVL